MCAFHYSYVAWLVEWDVNRILFSLQALQMYALVFFFTQYSMLSEHENDLENFNLDACSFLIEKFLKNIRVLSHTILKGYWFFLYFYASAILRSIYQNTIALGWKLSILSRSLISWEWYSTYTRVWCDKLCQNPYFFLNEHYLHKILCT